MEYRQQPSIYCGCKESLQSPSSRSLKSSPVLKAKSGQLARRLLDRFPILIIDRAVADLAATLRRQNRWKMPDALQAAVAKRHKLKFATRDTDDFSPKRHRFVIVPYTL